MKIIIWVVSDDIKRKIIFTKVLNFRSDKEYIYFTGKKVNENGSTQGYENCVYEYDEFAEYMILYNGDM